MNAKLTEQVKIWEKNWLNIANASVVKQAMKVEWGGEGSTKYKIMAKGMFTLATNSWRNFNP